ncbi:MAG: porin [Deltaproteobacteria bacterium]|nr:porin [Deltaproteobacteria bacterium]
MLCLPTARAEEDKEKPKETPWYERFTLRGYMQLRYDRLYATEEGFHNELADKAIGDESSFSLRRARLVLAGDVAPRIAMYLQMEIAGAAAKMRDWYGDLALDRDKELRIRLGQSKLPYGFENMQSSQNRLPLDRSDPINSAAPGERDLGAFVYWAPKATRKMFKYLVESGLKGSGDYGVLAVGAYAGQGLNVDDRDGRPHVVARATYPMKLGEQIVEPGVQAYAGRVTPDKSPTTLGGDAIGDARAGATLVVYPQPIGVQVEYNAGIGPELVGDTIRPRSVRGGYAMVHARIPTGAGVVSPYVRAAEYRGGIKSIKDAPHHASKELVVGAEWLLHKRVELTMELDHAKRTVADTTVWGTIVRAQVQLSY